MTSERLDVISTRQAAARLGVALRTVQLWVEQGSLKAWKTVGGHRRVYVDSVERMIAERAARTGVARTSGPLRLLVVEDDPHLRRLFELNVPTWTPQVNLLLARDGFEGLLKTGMHRPDVIITDLMMPGMDGFRMIHSLKADPSITALIIAVTALDESSIRDRGGLPEDIVVIRKPARMADLQSVVCAGYRRHLEPSSASHPAPKQP